MSCTNTDNANCRHIKYDSKKGLWTIPSGIHLFSGVTVSSGGFLDDRAISHQKEVMKDELVKDLQEILSDYIDQPDINECLEDLVIYIAARDIKVMIHGYNVGKRAER